VPLLVQWDDHETLNNWYPGEILDDARYKVKNCDLLAARARRAFFDYHPIRETLRAPGRVYRRQSHSPLLDVFLIDERTHRGPNTKNVQKAPGPDTAFLGREQLDWLKRALKESKATWKVIAADMPLGLIVRDAGGTFENAANGDGPPLGRELESAELLRFLKAEKVRNVIRLTADVHYAAAHYYDPVKAQFTDFDPFWEFIAGPLHAGTFGPGTFDNTFGPQLKYRSVEPGMKQARPPSDGLQFFGTVRIDGKSEVMTVKLVNAAGKELYAVDLEPIR
jgi:alkaline phosphatase D